MRLALIFSILKLILSLYEAYKTAAYYEENE